MSTSALPPIAICQRLEQVRETEGFDTLKAFWTAVTTARDPDDAYDVSYEAVRNYHSTREPPVSYLARVADRFDYTLRWLVTGDGPRRRREDPLSGEGEGGGADGLSDGAWSALRDMVPLLDDTAPFVRPLLLSTLSAYLRNAERQGAWKAPVYTDGGGRAPETPAEKARAVARMMARVFRAPLEHAPVDPPGGWFADTYILNMAEVLRVLLAPYDGVASRSTRVHGGPSEPHGSAGTPGNESGRRSQSFEPKVSSPVLWPGRK